MHRSGAAIFALALCLAAPARAGDVVVRQAGRTFTPSEVHIEVGDSIVFDNDDTIDHNVFSRSEGAKFNLKIQKPGEQKSATFHVKGQHVVRCAIHPKMRLTVHVE